MIGCVKKIHLHRSLPTACMPCLMPPSFAGPKGKARQWQKQATVLPLILIKAWARNAMPSFAGLCLWQSKGWGDKCYQVTIFSIMVVQQLLKLLNKVMVRIQ